MKIKKLINFIKQRRLFFFLVCLAVLSLLVKLLFLYNQSTAFTYDQGRDFLDLREMGVMGKLRLIGANTSLHGVFYGPAWYWLAIPFYLITGGNPYSSLMPLLLLSVLMPLLFFLLIKNKRLGFVLAAFFLFSLSFFNHSIVALNTNPMIFITPLFILFLAKFLDSKRGVYLWATLFTVSVSFHFEPIIGLLGIPIVLVATIFQKRVGVVLKNKWAALAFLAPFTPQALFEFRHNFLQTRTVLTLFSGGENSLTAAKGDIFFRASDRWRVFNDVFANQFNENSFLTIVIFGFVLFFVAKFLIRRKIKNEEDSLLFITLLSLLIVFIGFTVYPYALWPWYLGTVDALMTLLIGMVFYFALRTKLLLYPFFGLMVMFLFVNVRPYLQTSVHQELSADPANLRTRMAVIDLIYEESEGRGMRILTFAPYVYDYPYQYLIWWRAKTKYGYLPQGYYYLPDQTPYVVAKDEADSLIPVRESGCDWLIIEPFESQEEWFWYWRYRFGDSAKVWNIGKTKIERLCK